MKFLKKFETLVEYNAFAQSEEFVEPNTSSIVELGEIRFNDDRPQHDYSHDYLTFNIISGGTIYWNCSNSESAKTISYSKDNGATWYDVNPTGGSVSITVNDGDKVLFKGDNATYGYRYDGEDEYWESNCYFSAPDVLYEVEGNIMSLINSTGFTNLTTLSSGGTFSGFFSIADEGLISAENLILPSTALTYGCYSSMFYGCTSLTAAPELPATTLANFCYNGMFMDCESLTTAPELPATTLADYCYYEMFYNCSSLNYIKCLATDISASNCTTDWVGNVSSTGTFIKNPNMSNWTTGNNGIPDNWIVQDAS